MDDAWQTRVDNASFGQLDIIWVALSQLKASSTSWKPTDVAKQFQDSNLFSITSALELCGTTPVLQANVDHVGGVCSPCLYGFNNIFDKEHEVSFFFFGQQASSASACAAWCQPQHWGCHCG